MMYYIIITTMKLNTNDYTEVAFIKATLKMCLTKRYFTIVGKTLTTSDLLVSDDKLIEAFKKSYNRKLRLAIGERESGILPAYVTKEQQNCYIDKLKEEYYYICLVEKYTDIAIDILDRNKAMFT